MKLEPLFQFASDILREANATGAGVGAGFAGGQAASGPGGGGKAGPREVPQASDAEEWAVECTQRAALCAVAFLDPSKGDRFLDQHLSVLGKAQEAVGEEKPVAFVWVDGTRNGPLLRAVDLPTDALPSFAVVAPRKERAAPLRGRFAADAIAEHVQGVLDGSVKTFQTGPLPAFGGAAEEGGAAGAGGGDSAAEELPLEAVFGEEKGAGGEKGAGRGERKAAGAGHRGDGEL